MFEWNLLTVLAIISACFSLYILCLSMFPTPAKGLEQRMKDFAKQAVHVAQSENQATLDYSLGSIASVDRILEEFHLRHRTQAIPERELSRIVLTWGGYVGTVLQNRIGGHWQADSGTAGNNTYPLQCGNQEAVPVMWCLQRIRRGPSESVLTKSQMFLASFEPTSNSVQSDAP
jgi:hypothetical protein